MRHTAPCKLFEVITVFEKSKPSASDYDEIVDDLLNLRPDPFEFSDHRNLVQGLAQFYYIVASLIYLSKDFPGPRKTSCYLSFTDDQTSEAFFFGTAFSS